MQKDDPKNNQDDHTIGNLRDDIRAAEEQMSDVIHLLQKKYGISVLEVSIERTVNLVSGKSPFYVPPQISFQITL